MTLLESQRLAVVGNLGVIDFLKEFTILNESFVLDGVEVKWLTLSTSLLAWGVLDELDVGEILGSFIRVIAVEIKRILPHIVDQLELSILPPGPNVLPASFLSLGVPWNFDFLVLVNVGQVGAWFWLISNLVHVVLERFINDVGFIISILNIHLIWVSSWHRHLLD